MTNAEIQLLRDEKRALELRLAAAQAQIPTMALEKVGKVKVSEKGALSFYTGGKFPTTVYKSQLDKILKLVSCPQFAEFLESNKEKIAVKTTV